MSSRKPKHKEQKPSGNLLFFGFATAMTSAVATVIGSPFDRARLTMHTAIVRDGTRFPGGVIDFIRKHKWYRGVWAAVLRNSLFFSTNLTMYNFLCQNVPPYDARSGYYGLFWRSFALGFSAAIPYTLFFHPIENIYVRLATAPDGRGYVGIRDCLRSVVQNEGILSLYRGFGISLLSVPLWWACTLGAFQVARLGFGRNPAGSVIPELSLYYVPGLAVGLANAITLPLDSLRLRWMLKKEWDVAVQQQSKAGKMVRVRFPTGLGWAVRSGGLKGLYKGVFANVVYCIAYVGLVLQWSPLPYY